MSVYPIHVRGLHHACAEKFRLFQLVQVQPEERLATTSEPSLAPSLVTGCREAKGRGYRAATKVKGLSTEINHRVGGRRCAWKRKAALSYPLGRGYASPTVSKTAARYQKESLGTREAHHAPVRVWATKPINGKVDQMVWWESD
jgi:hypothetical protein